MARSYIRNSSIEYFPSLIKTQHFNDTVSNLTIFVENKTADGLIKNIFIKENFNDSRSQIISAREGILAKRNDSFYLISSNPIDITVFTKKFRPRIIIYTNYIKTF